MTVADAYPPFGLRIEAGRLALIPIDDAVLPALIELALDGIHKPGTMPFAMPWTAVPADELRHSYPQYHWGLRSRWSRASWTLECAVEYDGEIVGIQGIGTSHYLVTRTGETGSWLALKHQGRGIGTQMRQAMCAFMFDNVDAAEITSAAFTDNPNSLAVSRKVGYRPDGDVRVQRGDALAFSRRLVLTPETFVRGEPIKVTGAEAFRAYIGLDS